MSEAYSDVVQSVNTALDARSVLTALGIHPDSIVAIGTRLKSHCPVHRGDGFKSLQIDSIQKNCQCIVKECEVHTPQSLVSLYATCRHRSELAAALELAHRFSLPIPESTVAAIRAASIAAAEQAEKNHDFPLCAHHLAVAFFTNPDNLELAERLATVRDRAGDEVGAAEAFLYAARMAEKAGELKRAIRLLEQKAAVLDPENREILRELSRLQRLRDPADEAWARTLLLHADIAANRDHQYETAAEDFSEALAILRHDGTVSIRYADILEAQGRQREATEALREAAEMLAIAGHTPEALAALDRIVQSDPEDHAARRRAVEIRANSGDVEIYKREMEALAREALSRDDDEAAQSHLEALMQRVPEHLFSAETLAQIYARQGASARQIDMLFAASSIATRHEFFDRAVKFLEEIRPISPKPLSDIERLGEAFATLGQADPARDQFFGAAMGYMAIGMIEKAIPCCQRLLELTPVDVDVNRRAAGELATAGHQQEGSDHLFKLATALAAEMRHREALLILDDLEFQEYTSEAIRLLKIEILCETHNEDRLLPAVIDVYKEFVAVGREGEAERILRRAIVVSPTSPELHEAMITICTNQGRESECLPHYTRLLDSPLVHVRRRLEAGRAALQLSPTDPALHYSLARALEEEGLAEAADSYTAAARGFLEARHLADAQRAVERGTRLSPAHHGLMELAAELALASSQVSRASDLYADYLRSLAENAGPEELILAYDRVTSRLPGSQLLQRMYADWLDSVGETDEAFNKYTFLADDFQAMDQWDEALEVLDHALRLKPEDYSTASARAEALSQLGRDDELHHALRACASLAAAAGRPDDVVRCLTTVRQANPLTEQEDSLLADALEQTGANEDAIAILWRLLAAHKERGDQDQTLQLSRRILRLDAGQTSVREDYAELLKLRGDLESAAAEYESLAGQLLLSGQKEQALHQLELATEICPDRPETRELILAHLRDEADHDRLLMEHHLLADVYTKRGRHADAVRHLRLLDEMAPEDPALLCKLAAAQEAAGDSPEAIESFSHAAAIHEGRGEAEAAIAVLRRIHALSPDDLSRVQHLAALLHRRGETADAVTVYLDILSRLIDRRQIDLSDQILIELQHIAGHEWRIILPVVELLETKGLREEAVACAETFMERADNAEQPGAALQACLYLIAAQPNVAALREHRAVLLAATGDREEAAAQFLQLIAEVEKSGPPPEHLRITALAATELPADERIDRCRVSALLKHADEQATLSETRRLLDRYAAAGMHAAARELLAQLAHAYPARTDIEFQLADALLAEGLSDDAVEHLRRLARSREKKQPEVARRAYERVLAILPDSTIDAERLVKILHADEHAALPHRLHLLALYSAASPTLNDFRKKARSVLDVTDTREPLRVRFSQLLAARGENDAAIGELLQLAQELADGGQPQAAIPHLKTALAQDPSRADLLLTLAEVSEPAGLADEAVSAWESLSRLHEEAADNRELCRALENLVRLQPANPAPLARLARLLDESEEHAQAADAYNRLLALNRDAGREADNVAVLRRLAELNGNDRAILEELARVLLSSGDAAGAATLWLAMSRHQRASAKLTEAIEDAQRGKDVHPDSAEVRRELLSLYLETKRLDSYSRETEELAGLHLSHDQVQEAIQLLSENLTRLIEIKEFRLVAGLLDPFRNLVHESPVLLRFMALSLEGIGREREACTLWIELADLHERDQSPLEMEKVLRRAVALKPKDLLLRQRLIAVLRQGEEERKPDLVAELQELASILEGQKSKDELRDAYEQILALDPDNAEALSGLSSLLIVAREKVRAAELLIRLGDVQKDIADADAALPSYKRAAELDPSSGTARRRLMDAAREVGDTNLFTSEAFALADILQSIAADEDALSVYTSVLRELPENREGLQRLAEFHLRRGEEATAASHLRELYRLDLESGNLSQAFDVLHRIEKLDPENAETQELLGRLYLRIHDRDQAFSYLKSAAEKQAASGNLAAAISITGDLIALDPHEKSLRKLRANLFMHAGDKDSAVVEFLELANIHRLEEDLEAELRALREAVTLRPDNLEYRERLALLLSDMDEPQEAFDQFMRLASEREDKGNPDGAIEALRMAAMLVPDSFDVQARLADLYEERGDTIHAEAALLWLADWHESRSDTAKACQAIERILRFSRGSALLGRASRLMHQAGRKDTATELYRELLAQAEVDGEGSIAREAAEALLSISSRDVEVIRRVGRHYMKAAQQSRASDVFFEGFAAIVEDGDIESAQSLIPDLLAASADVLETRERIAQVYATNGIPELAARDLLEIARELDANSSPDEALRAVDAALSHAPNSQPARELRFALLIKTGNANDAYELGEKLIAFLESRGAGEPMLAIARQMIALRPQEPAPREAIIRHLRESNQTVPLTDEMRHLAEIYTLRKELDKASAMLQDLLRVLPDDTRARTQYIDTYRQIGPEGDLINDYAKLAEIHTRHGAILEATKIYEKILAIAPQQLDLRDRFIEFLVLHAQTTRAIPESYQLVALCLENHQPRKALKVLDRVARHVMDDPDYHHLLGRVHRELNSRGMAAKCFERAAEIYRAAGNTVRQIEVLRELLKIDSLNLEVRQRMIEALVGSEQKSEAISAMEELARTYMERGLPDLAQAEYRRIITIDPSRRTAWEALFSVTERFGKPEDLAPDYIAFAQQMADLGDPAKAVEYLRKIVTMEIPDIQLRKQYIDLYLRAGKPKEIVEDIIALAQTLVEAGNVDEAIQYFERAMSIDPGNTKARDLLTATHAAPSTDAPSSGRADSSSAADDTRRKALRRIDSSLDLAEASSQMGAPNSVTASDYLLGTISQLERQESEEALAQIVNNYLDILSVNAQNAAVRVKLADVLEQMGRIPQMLQQLAMASETYFNKNELSQCATVCERYLRVNPGDQRIRKRLNEAILKRDAYKAIESAILYTDKPSTSSPDSRTTG